MTDPQTWQKNNETYLAATLAWLRLRLEQLASGGQPKPLLVPSKPVPSQPRSPRLFQWAELEPSRPVEVMEEADLNQAAKVMAVAQAANPSPALVTLSQRLGLSVFEQEILLLCAALELDTRMAILCAQAQNDPHRPYPTFALAMTLFDEPAWDTLSPERPLRYWRLIEINQPGAQPLTTSPLRADEHIVNYLKGLYYLDDRLTPWLTPLELGVAKNRLPPSQQLVVEAILNHLERRAPEQPLPLIQLLGPDTASKQEVARAAANELGVRLYRLPVELLPPHAAEAETLARLWQRDSLLLPVALYLDALDRPGAGSGEERGLLLRRFLNHNQSLIFLDTYDMQPGLSEANLVLDINKPAPAEQQTAWIAFLGREAGELAAQLAGQFNLNLADIRQIVQTILAEAPAESETRRRQLWDACLAVVRPRLDILAQRLEPKATWADIVLPEEELAMLRQIADQVRQRGRVYETWGFREKMNRGLGVSVLFAGESGTGKTMAAEVIANDLRLNLYRIDLSGVVSKYIGETEKNLRRLFDAAEDGGAMLFFDEADALFGKRSEVKDSHDRYANIEVNYLLQRMEAYRGLAILATNMRSSLDLAFIRRLRFIVNFPFPGPAERKRIWQLAFPPRVPLDPLDYDRLARFSLTGGSIHNIALNAAFLAARTTGPVTMPLVLAATKNELRKLERSINEADFRWEEPGSKQLGAGGAGK